MSALYSRWKVKLESGLWTKFWSELTSSIYIQITTYLKEFDRGSCEFGGEKNDIYRTHREHREKSGKENDWSCVWEETYTGKLKGWKLGPALGCTRSYRNNCEKSIRFKDPLLHWWMNAKWKLTVSMAQTAEGNFHMTLAQQNGWCA